MTFHLNELESFVQKTTTFSSLVGLAAVIFDVLPCPIFIKNSEARFVFINKAYETHFGIEKDEIIGKSVMDLEYLDMEARVQYQLEDTYIIRNAISRHHKYNYTFTDGTIHQCLYWSCGFHNKEEGSRGLIGFLVDISQSTLKKENTHEADQTHTKSHTEDLSSRDPVTGMQDSHAFTKHINALSQRAGKRLAFSAIMIDVKNCMKNSDAPKGKVEDKTLKLIASVLSVTCREHDSVYKWDAEKFVMLLPNTTAADGQCICDRLNQALQEQVVNHTDISLNIAIVQYSKLESTHDLMERATNMVDLTHNA